MTQQVMSVECSVVVIRCNKPHSGEICNKPHSGEICNKPHSGEICVTSLTQVRSV